MIAHEMGEFARVVCGNVGAALGVRVERWGGTPPYGLLRLTETYSKDMQRYYKYDKSDNPENSTIVIGR